MKYRKALFVVLTALRNLAPAQVARDTETAYQWVNQASGRVLGVRSTTAAAVELKDSGKPGTLWHFMPAGKNQYKIVNLWSGELLRMDGSSTLIQGPDDGSADRLWQIAGDGNGNVKIQSVSGGFVIGTEKLVPAGPAYPPPMEVSGDVAVHDPSIIKVRDGSYYLFGTHSRIRMSSSPDLRHFTEAGQVFAEMPGWTAAYAKGDLWAPDVSYHAGKYWLYYAASSFGKNTSAIGLATSASAAPGSWSDQGIVLSSQPSDNFNAIDPGLVIDAAGKWWMSFGSFWSGLKLTEIDPATGKRASNNTLYPLAHRPASPAIEAAFIFEHGKYYFLFASFDQCCRGVESTYHIVVGRSSSVKGPYIDRGGVAMLEGGGTIFLSTHGRVAGPGGQVVMQDGGNDLLIYHYYDGDNHGARTLGINRIGWDSEEWPYLQ